MFSVNKVDGALSQIRLDIDYLKANRKDHFANTALAKAGEILGRKTTYKPFKQQHQELYGEYKMLVKQLRESKLPYRFVDLVNNCLKMGQSVPESGSPEIQAELKKLPRKPIKEERKRQVCALEKILVDQSSEAERASSLAERTCWMHGTNSALLPLLRSTANILLPAGALLNRGLAPMSGELAKNGMCPRFGVSQRAISADTIKGMERCWDYALDKSRTSHFSEDRYKDSETFFLSTLEELSCTHSLVTTTWDMPLVHLLRFKQWNPGEFARLCLLHSDKIVQMKKTILSASFPLESKALELATFTKEQLEQYVKGSSEDRRRFEEDYFLSSRWDKDDSIFFDNPIGRFLSEFIERGSLNRLYSYNLLAGLILFGQKQIEQLKIWACEAPLDFPGEGGDADYFAFLRQHLRRETWEKLTAECGENPDLNSVIEKFVKKKIDAIIKDKNRIIQGRLDRLERLFDLKPQIELSARDRQMIVEAFPILFASTKTRATPYSDEFHVKEAQLGSAIDQVYVETAHLEQMRRFLEENKLDKSVEVIDAEVLQTMKLLPRVAAPYQVGEHQSYLRNEDQSVLNRNLKEWVIPLYRASYTTGEARKHHGVPHAIRAVLFSQVFLELYRAQGMAISTPAGDLQLATALHDNARENDGVDLWEKQSGEKCEEVFTQKLNRTVSEATAAGRWIVEKDSKEPVSLEQKILHDSDCIELMRCLVADNDFRMDELWISKDIADKDLVEQILVEGRKFIALTETPVIKEFITNCSDPYPCLIQIMKASGQFIMMENYLKSAVEVFCSPSENQLTPEIQEQLKINTK